MVGLSLPNACKSNQRLCIYLQPIAKGLLALSSAVTTALHSHTHIYTTLDKLLCFALREL